MALTKISTDGVKDDAITKAKIPANQIEASELADNAVDTNAIADQAVALSKLPHGDSNNNGKFLRANNGADPSFETIAQPDLTNLSASNLTSGTIPDARLPATLPAISGANLTNLPSNRINRNLIINGAMQVAQRGTSSTSSGYKTVDRILFGYSGHDEALTQSQGDVASGTTPYTLGFRKTFKVTNGNQTSGAGSSDYVYIDYSFEAQDIANSGWNYNSASSFVTFSFWIKSSVAQSFKGYFITDDGTDYSYAFDTGSLSANTWTKVTKTIPGNSNLTINNDNGKGLAFSLWPFIGTDFSSNSTSEDAWVTHSGSARTKDATSTWYTTNDATFEITGVQLEVGSVATDFEHRSFGQELALCQRYFEFNRGGFITTTGISSGYIGMTQSFVVGKRASPTVTRVSDAADQNSVGTAFAESITINGFRAVAQVTGAAPKLDTLFKIECEL